MAPLLPEVGSPCTRGRENEIGVITKVNPRQDEYFRRGTLSETSGRPRTEFAPSFYVPVQLGLAS